MNKRIYLDYNATAPILLAVADLVFSIMQETGNASSIHFCGRRARAHIEKAREQLAGLISCDPNYVIFTSGASEANNMVLSSFENKNIWVSEIEHPSVLKATPDTKKIPVEENGVLNLDALEKMLQSSKPDLISIMMVNNETGIIQPVEQAARLAKKVHPNVYIHTDAVQAAGRIKIDMGALQTDFLSLSAHKMGGPQGVGAIIAMPGTHPLPLIKGGGQEKSLRAGTENVAGIAGFGLAAEIAKNKVNEFQKLAELRAEMEKQIKTHIPSARIFGEAAPRVANTTAMSIPEMKAQTIIMALDLAGISVSSGSACSSGKVKLSHVGQAMGIKEEILQGAFRISMTPSTNEKDLEQLVSLLIKTYSKKREKALSD
jgi:cysteine desulfurase